MATTKRGVTERDLRAPDFRDCDPEDMEWRADGTLARRDRWERGIREIAGVIGMDPRKEFEVSDVVLAVRARIGELDDALGTARINPGK